MEKHLGDFKDTRFSWPQLNNYFFKDYETIYCFAVNTRDMKKSLRSVSDSLDNLGVRHCKKVFDMYDNNSAKKTVVWIVGLMASESQIVALQNKEFIGKVGMTRISKEKKLPYQNFNLSYVLSVNTEMIGYINTTGDPLPNDSQYNKSLVIVYHDSQSYKMTEELFDKLESAKFNTSTHKGFKHSKIIFQTPTQSDSKTSVYITFHDDYNIIKDVINSVKRMIDLDQIYQPTDSVVVGLSNTQDPEQIKKGLESFFGESAEFSYFKDPRYQDSSSNYSSSHYYYRSRWQFQKYRYVTYFGSQQGPYLNSKPQITDFSYAEGVDESDPQIAPYHVIIEAKSPQYISSFDGNIADNSTFQLFSDEIPYYNKSGKAFKLYRLYQQPGFFDLKMEDNQYASYLTIHYTTTRLHLAGSTLASRSLIESLSRKNGIPVQVFGSLEQTALVNNQEDAAKLFQIITQNTSFTVHFIEEFTSCLEEENKIETETNGEKAQKEVQEEEEGILKMVNGDEIAISTNNMDDAIKTLQRIKSKSSFNISFEEITSKCKDNQCKFKISSSGKMVIMCSDMEKSARIVQFCRKGKKINIECKQ